MTEKQRDPRPHFILSGTGEAEKFVSPNRVIKEKPPALNRAVHAQALLGQLSNLRANAAEAKQAQEDAGMDSGYGLQIQFASQPEVELAFESLARERAGIELLNVRQEGNQTYASVFVPDGKLDVFEKLIHDYLAEKKDRNNKPRDNQALIDSIQNIRTAEFEALWTDVPEALPQSDTERIWWEVWLPVRDDRQETVTRFRDLAQRIGFEFATGELAFPERTVLMMRGSKRQIQQSVLLLNSVAELRRAPVTAELFDSLKATEQPEWIDDLLARTRYAPGSAPHVCILDTGVNNGHPLITSALQDVDLHTVNPDWSPADEHGHGTEMAGIALFGDLTHALESNMPIELSHRLESVKLLRDASGNQGENHGYLTAEAIARAEVQAPRRRRVFSMAVTARDLRDKGRPTAWSGAIDRLTCDYEGDGLTPRLIVLSAGNVHDPENGNQIYNDYPASNTTDGIHEPGQAWNALTVGAYTEKVHITENGAEEYVPIAPNGGLSPFSTTSTNWERHWPLKPDVVFEGGNVGKDALGPVTMQSLSLLTTHKAPHERLLTTTWATSPAAQLCARMGAQLMAAYPALWPETIRALVIHSAEWTPSMLAMFKPRDTARDYLNLIRHCGFGVPDLDRAMWSLSNSLTLIVQDELQPFAKEQGKSVTTRDMHVHQLPWPLVQLEQLGELEVEMRVTLSYFIEPNPAERGVKGKYRYPSHGLRFDVKRPTEDIAALRARVNREARDEEERTAAGGNDPGWVLGKQLRHRGSIHSDIWRGTAADLAQRGALAIFPAIGWWKTRTALERHDKKARYALVVSIRAPEAELDLYNAVENLMPNVVAT